MICRRTTLDKYGQRFIDVIAEFAKANPDAVISTRTEDENQNGEDDDRTQKNVGMRWMDEEDARLIAEFQSGMKMSEIAKIHGRTNGAVRSRLQKYGMG